MLLGRTSRLSLLGTAAPLLLVDAADDEQAAKVVLFRQTMTKLGQAVADLRRSVGAYDAGLHRIRREVEGLGAKTRRLETLMDEAAAGRRPAFPARAA